MEVSSKRECPYHKKRQLVFLSTDLSQSNLLKCTSCITGSVQTTSLIPIQDLEECDKKTIFQNWPFPEDRLTTDLQQLPDPDIISKQFDDSIAKYFNEAKEKIGEWLDQSQKAMIEKAINVSSNSLKTVEAYNKISVKFELKKILEENNSIEDKEKAFKLIIKQAQDKLDKTFIKEELRKFKEDSIPIKFDQPNQILQLLKQQIQAIDLFIDPKIKGNTLSDQHLLNDQLQTIQQNQQITSLQLQVKQLQQQLLQQQIEQQQQLLKEQKQKQKAANNHNHNSTSKLIFKFVSNPFNQCSDKLLTCLENLIFNKFGSELDKVDLSSVVDNKIHSKDWSKLNKKQLGQLGYMADKMVASNLNRINLAQREQNVLTLIKLIQNPLNSCSINFLHLIRMELSEISEFFTCLDFPRNCCAPFENLDTIYQNDSFGVIIELSSLVQQIVKLAPTMPSINEINERKKLLSQSFVSSKESFDPEFVNALFAMMDNFQLMFGCTLFNKPFQILPNQGNPLIYSELNSTQRDSIQVLINKIIDQGKLNGSFSHNQFNIKSNNSLSVSKYLHQYSYQGNILQLLNNYPIFELLNCQILYPAAQTISPNQSTSFQGKVEKQVINGIVFLKIGSNEISQMFMSLNNLKHYIIRFRSSLPICKGSLAIGLIKEGQANKHDMMKTDSICFVSNQNRGNVLPLIQNDHKFVDKVGNVQNFEIRLSLTEQKIYFLDYPAYSSPYYIQFDQNVDLAFAIRIENFSDLKLDYNILEVDFMTFKQLKQLPNI